MKSRLNPRLLLSINIYISNLIVSGVLYKVIYVLHLWSPNRPFQSVSWSRFDWRSDPGAELEACSLLARNIPEHTFTPRSSPGTANRLTFAHKICTVEYFLASVFWWILKKIVKFRIGENYLAGKFSLICSVTFQYIVYDPKIMMGRAGGGGEMYAISPEE